ncbi:uncharacterized protein LOC110973940 [Acanthaster planci]|uniref:Uncharacterized protein LOC110973940 n=1 Tax=Acanthaster planci TaxID=133434 RepID=A0A8B7XLP7_ACAPL|nr:uncharacterized protein LOC110973940 [Acanthaster planci]XP_022080891.1 uncharacterized protein LOC110973940 [Acanthaster planci]
MDAEPKPLGSGRPERYEIEDHDSGSPLTYTSLKTFDASRIFSKNPRKYDRLIAQEEGYSKDDSAFSDTEIDMPRYRSCDAPMRLRNRSNSLTSLDTVIAMQTDVAQAQPKVPEMDDSNIVASHLADHMYRRCSLDHMADYYSRRSSDAAVTAIWEPTSHGTLQTSTKTTVESAVATYKIDKKTAEKFGEGHLSDIMMKAAFKETLTSPKKDEEKTKEQRISVEGGRASPAPSKEAQDRRMSLPETAKDVEKTSVGEEVSVKVTSVHPEPRRLFGIGPLYHPLPEMVVEGVTSTDGSLVNKIKKEGLAMGAEAKSGKKKPPTKAEINTWAPFSM